MTDKTFTVYILECIDGTFYTGISSNLEKRIHQHNEGVFPNCYTNSRRPVRLVFTADFNIVQSAIEFEKQVKGWSRKKKLALINNQFDELKILSKCLNFTSHLNH